MIEPTLAGLQADGVGFVGFVYAGLMVAPDGAVASAVPPGGAPLAGRQVEGVMDGAFAGGYFLTVRVDGCLLRGLVWDDARATSGGVASDANR